MAIFRGVGDATGNAAISEIENLRSDAQLAATEAEDAQGYAEEWANKAEDSLVSTAAGGDGVDDYSALHWSIKSSDSATLAIEALDEFTDLYLGAKATEPALDNDGDALQDGALYFNTTSSNMFVYDLSTTTWLGVSGEGFLVAANNLSDLGNAATSRTNLGVEIGVDVQEFSATTANYADVTANFTGTLQNGGSNVVVDSDIGASVQAFDADTAKYDDVTANFTGTLQEGGVDVATTADIPSQLQTTWNTGTDTTESRISAAKLDAKILDRFNVTGSAPLFACRAWVNFNGSVTVSIRQSGNVDGITDNSVGDYSVEFTTAMEDVDYIMLTGSSRQGEASDGAFTSLQESRNTLRTASNIRVRSIAVSDAVYLAIDAAMINLAFVR